MTINVDLLVLMFGCVIVSCGAFYKPATFEGMTTHTPTTIQELKDLLCKKKPGAKSASDCDHEPRKIIINKVFDFTSEELKTERACPYDFLNNNCEGGKLFLKRGGGCDPNDKLVDTQYSQAGMAGLSVGSNKIIEGHKGGGLKGKGLRLVKASNVEIRGISITEINPHLFLGGSAIDLQGATNVLIDGNYFKNIGYHMIITRLGINTGVTISNNLFDGHTPFSEHCDGTHMYLWNFMGEAERILLEHNTVLHTSSRAPWVYAQRNTTSVVHMYRNSFHQHKHFAAIYVKDKRSSVLVEGNVFSDVKQLVHDLSVGNVFIVRSQVETVACGVLTKRTCLPNTMVNVEGPVPRNSMQVFNDFEDVAVKGGN